MAVSTHVQRFQALGFSGKDVRHIGVRVRPALVLESGQPVQRHKVFVGEANGDFQVDFPTDFIFALGENDWVFDSFQLDGKTWPGLAIFPDDGDFTVAFGDAGQKSVVLTDACMRFYVHRYQVVLRNTATGEVALSDPSTSNSDRDDD